MWAWIVENWEFVVGTAIGVIGIVIAIITVAYQHSPKTLDYKVVGDVRVLNIAARGDWEVHYKGRHINDPRIVVIRFTNTGKQPITASDFAVGKPISVTYETNPYWSASLVNPTDTDSVSLAVIDDGPPLSITPTLLNPGEHFDVQFLSEKTHGRITASSRFAGQAQAMRNLNEAQTSKQNWFIAWTGATFILLVFATILGTIQDGFAASTVLLVAFLLFAIPMFSIFLRAVIDIVSRKNNRM